MAQRRITAFFTKPKTEGGVNTEVKKTEPKSPKEEAEAAVLKEVKNEIVKDTEDSPIKKPVRKRAAFIDSDEDSQDSEKKKFKHQLSSSGESEDETPKIVVKLSNPIKKKAVLKLSDSFRKTKEIEKSDNALESSEDDSGTVSNNISVSPPSVELKLKKAKVPKGKSPNSPSSNQEKYNPEPSPTKTNEKASKGSSSALKTNGKSKIEKESPVEKKKKIKQEKESPMSSEQTEEIGGGAVPVDISDYNPSKSNYHPIKDAAWKRGDPVPYMALARTLELIESISSRLKMIEILSNYFRSVSVLCPDDLLPSVYLCLNQLAPAYVGLELGVGEGIIIKALAQATGRAPDKVKADAASKGDLGLVAEMSKGTQRTLFMFKPASLTVKGVFDKLTEIATMTGNASQGKKVDKIHGLLVASKQLEARYITRSLAGKLRIGLAEQSLLQALALASTLTPLNQSYPPAVINTCKGLSTESIKAKVEENALLIKTAYCQCPSYDRIVPVLLREGIASLPDHCTLTPGIPLKPMLACPTRGVGEVLQRFESSKFTCEWKYDGERAQIHLLENGDIRIYSRNQENNTSKYPDIIGRFPSWLIPSANVRSAILDTEAVAWDVEKKQILPFQVLSTRKRKDAVEAEIKVQVCIFAFDMLFINGESLVQKPLLERRNRLRASFQEVEGQFRFATSRDPSSVEEIEEFLDESLKGHCEGLMVKALEVHATYEIARRSHNWLKLKKDYLEGVGDTIDAVVIGGYLGKGKRTGLYGGFLLACYDESNEEYQTLCKIGTGFSDEDFQKHGEFFKDQVIPKPKPYYRFDSSQSPDHWFEPVQVWEIKCADLSISPVHRAAVGIVDPNKGISLRFPRFLRIRDDKNPEDATNATQIAELYQSQEQVKSRKVVNEEEEEGFY